MKQKQLQLEEHLFAVVFPVHHSSVCSHALGVCSGSTLGDDAETWFNNPQKKTLANSQAQPVSDTRVSQACLSVFEVGVRSSAQERRVMMNVDGVFVRKKAVKKKKKQKKNK